MGKWRRPRTIDRHALTKATGSWGQRRSTLALWLRSEAKYECALGPGATVGVLGMGVPRLVGLRPTAWFHRQPGVAQIRHRQLKTLARGQASRGEGQQDLPGGAASLGWLPRSGDIYARCTSRGSRDVSHDDQGQASASRRSVPVSPLVLRRQARVRSPEESGKGFHIGATRPRPPR